MSKKPQSHLRVLKQSAETYKSNGVTASIAPSGIETLLNGNIADKFIFASIAPSGIETYWTVNTDR